MDKDIKKTLTWFRDRLSSLEEELNIIEKEILKHEERQRNTDKNTEDRQKK